MKTALDTYLEETIHEMSYDELDACAFKNVIPAFVFTQIEKDKAAGWFAENDVDPADVIKDLPSAAWNYCEAAWERSQNDWYSY